MKIENSKLKIAVIIVTYNNEKTIRKCLESILNSNLECVSFKVSLKIHIIDNASRDKPIQKIKNFLSKYFPDKNPLFPPSGKGENNSPLFEGGLGGFSVVSRNVKIVENKNNIGFSAAVNQGIQLAQKESDPDFFFLLNPDAWLAPNCLKKLVNDQNHQSKIINHQLVSPLILDSKTNRPWFSGGNINWLRMRTKHVVRNHESEIRNQELENPDYELQITDYLTGCCLLIPKQIIKKIGLLDEKFFLYYEDTDFSLRAKKAGFDLKIVPKAICYHSESISFNQPEKLSGNTIIKQLNNKALPIHHSSFITHHSKNYYLVKSALTFFHKHYPSWAKSYFWSIYYLRFLYHRHISKKQDVIKAFQDFWKKH